MRMQVLDGVVVNALFSVTTSGFLVAYALALGANSLQIGILASIPYITQLIQVPAILLVEHWQSRKAISTVSYFFAQGFWFPIALLPLFTHTPSSVAISLLLGLLAIRGAMTAISSCAWNGWVRDLVPQHVIGSFFSSRLAWATAVSIIFGLGGALFVDYWRGRTSVDTEILGYTLVLLFGAMVFGMSGPIFSILTPERRTAPIPTGRSSLWKTLVAPLRDNNFRQLAKFLFFWGVASNLAVPFFSVYMLQRLEFPISAVIGLGVLSQLSNLVFVRVWGTLADRFSFKTVMSLSASLYLLVILGWVFTTMPERYFLTIPLLVILHIMAGVALAGITLTTTTIGLKLAPETEATSYLAGVSLAISLGAGIGPLLGGAFANYFSVRELSFEFSWADPNRIFNFPVLHLTGFDFLFAVAFLLGLITLRFLAGVREEGEVGREVVLEELMGRTRSVSRALSSIPGLRGVGMFPYGFIRHVPGLDVALSVMAYELTASTKAAVAATARGGAVAADVTERVSRAVSNTIGRMERISEHGVDLARDATRGAVHGLGEVTEDVGHLTKGGVKGVLSALGRMPVDPWGVSWGAGYGAVQGADEAGVDLGEATSQTVEATREAAAELGLTEEEAATQAAQGALAAAEAISPEAAAQVEDAISEVLKPESSTQEEQPDQNPDDNGLDTHSR